MDFRGKILTAFGLTLLLLVGQISIITENDVENKEGNQSIPDIDVCTFYDYSLAIDYLIFQNNYKPLIVIIAPEFIDGINRVRNISLSKRIMNVSEFPENNNLKKVHELIWKHFYLFEAHNVYYFVYPVNILDNFFTIYCQKMLLSDKLGVTFDFVNVKKEYPFFEDILVPLKPSCSNCPLLEYVNKKLQTGESFSELFILREQLFREKTKYVSLKAFGNSTYCDSIGFNINSESESFRVHFNSLLQQILKNNNNSDESKKKSVFERTIKCFKTRHLVVTDEIFYDDIQEQQLKHPFTGINYLNFLNITVFSLNENDTSFGNICKEGHKIYIFKLFCFIKDVSDITSYNITAWIDTLQQLVTTSLVNELFWFDNLITLYHIEYLYESKIILNVLGNLKSHMLHQSKNWRSVMSIAYNLISNLMLEKSSSKTMLSTSCLFYNYLDTIDALLPEMEFKRLVIIVTDSMLTGVRKTVNIELQRVRPKINRQDLHYTKQFVYDELMKHFYLLKSNDTYYYVYPLNYNRIHDVLITYFEYKMIKDYSKVLFYIANYSNNFVNEYNIIVHKDVVFSALPDNCHFFTTNCSNNFLSPIYLIDLHREFHRRYSKYFSIYAFFYNNLTELINSPYSHFTENNYFLFAQEFYHFLSRQQISYDINYFLEDLPCSTLEKLNRRIDIKFSITEKEDLNYIATLTQSAYKNITSINITDNINLKYFCMNSNILKFIKFFCFLKINYVEGMLKVIDTKSIFGEKMKLMVENGKKVIIEDLSKTLKWMRKILFLRIFSKKILTKYNVSYSKMPNIMSNGADSLKQIYLVRRVSALSFRCNNRKVKN